MGAALALAPRARAQQAQARTLRVSMHVRALRDPRAFDWTEMGNLARAQNETLVRYTADHRFAPWLLEGWEVSPDATVYDLFARPAALWHNGEAFDARDIAAAFARWCEADAPGNSMATRLAALVDPQTRKLRDGAVEILGARHVRLRLSRPDATLIPSLADYPALVPHRDFNPEAGPLAPGGLGTGPWRIVELVPLSHARAERAPTPWWGGGVGLDAIDWRDPGPDPAAEMVGFETGALDLNMQSPARLATEYDALGLTRLQALTANTLCLRMNRTQAPFDDIRLRRAAQASVDPGVALELGYRNAGALAENHHVAPFQPDYAILPRRIPDPERARAEMIAGGYADTRIELVSHDESWQRDSADAVAAQLLDAGFKLSRRIVPSAEYWENWTRYPFSATDWAHRPLGVQLLALGYRADSPWNETGFADPDFDATLDAALAEPRSADRKALMKPLQLKLQESGVLIQPFWRAVFCHAAPRVRGFALHPALEMHLEQVTLAAS